MDDVKVALEYAESLEAHMDESGKYDSVNVRDLIKMVKNLAQPDWQPIETAPRDRRFIGYRPASEGSMESYIISFCKYRESADGKRRIYSEQDYEGIPTNGWTYWTPSPPPPKETI